MLVNASEQKIAAQIKDFRNWKNWYPAFQNKKIIVNISEKEDNSSVIITNEKKQKIIFSLIKSDSNINILLSKENEKDISYQFVLIPNGNGKTQLIWNVNTTFGWYPWKKLSGIFLDKVTGPQYVATLKSLKDASEK